MKLEIQPHNVERFQAALEKRRELIRMPTQDMPPNWMDQMSAAETTICAAIAVAANTATAA